MCTPTCSGVSPPSLQEQRMSPATTTRMLLSTLDTGTHVRDRKATTMIPRILPQAPVACGPNYTVEEWRALQWLRLRFQADGDPWSGRELAQPAAALPATHALRRR